MMSPEERRRLVAIEQQMYLEDPAFARVFPLSMRATGLAWRGAAAALVATLAALAACAGLVVGSVFLLLCGVSIGLAAASVVHRTQRPAN
jgi:hypothetical protein